MKRLRVLFVMLAGLGSLLAFGSASAATADIAKAASIDNQWHVLGANSNSWYRFYYTPTDQVTIRLISDNIGGLRFEVYTPSEAADWWESTPVGQGTPKGDDLLWSGSFNSGGVYYVQVQNDNPNAVAYTLSISGTSGQMPTMTQSSVAAPVAPSTQKNMSPDQAVALNALGQSIPAQSSLWYRFSYPAGDDSNVILRIPSGAANSLKFDVLTPEEAAKWWDTTPTGRGSASGDDLVYEGSFLESGTYYVRVVNDNPYAVGFQFLMELTPK